MFTLVYIYFEYSYGNVSFVLAQRFHYNKTSYTTNKRIMSTRKLLTYNKTKLIQFEIQNGFFSTRQVIQVHLITYPVLIFCHTGDSLKTSISIYYSLRFKNSNNNGVLKCTQRHTHRPIRVDILFLCYVILKKDTCLLISFCIRKKIQFLHHTSS